MGFIESLANLGDVFTVTYRALSTNTSGRLGGRELGLELMPVLKSRDNADEE